MSQFEFFMAFYSLLIGLGVAELLLGFVNLLRHRNRFMPRGDDPALPGRVQRFRDFADAFPDRAAWIDRAALSRPPR